MMSGFLNDLSPSQEEALRKFREAVDSIPNKPENDDCYYLRWLRARNFDTEAAIQMFRNHMKWRKEMEVDNIFQWTPPEVLEKYLPGRFFGEDREGHPVFYNFLGNVDVIGLYHSATLDDSLRYQIRNSEQASKLFREQTQKYGREIGTVTIIVDMRNLSYQRQYHWPAIQQIRKTFTLFADNYPERANVVLIINAPRIFPVVFNLYKRFIDVNTRRKIQVLGGNYEEVLQQYIAPDQLPQAFGGSRCEPDPECTDYLIWGGDVPKSYYLTNNTQTRKEDMIRVLVGRGSSHYVNVEVQAEESVISWEFVSTDYDISFGVLHKPFGERLTKSTVNTIVSTKRRQSHVVPESGTYHCLESGTYTLHFDNSYSWMRQKEVFYSVSVEEPDRDICSADVLVGEDSTSGGDREATGTTREVDKDTVLEPPSS